MKIASETYDHMAVLACKGEMVGDETDRLRLEALSQMEHDVRDFVLDLSGMEFIDSQGLETLIWLQDQSAESLGQVRLAACQENLTEILRITGLASRFDTHEDVESAVRSLR